MPMGDGSGPAGNGPRTGRGAGYCNGYDRPGSYNRGFGGRSIGLGLGRGRGGAGFGRGGFGRGFGNAGYASARGWDFPPMGVQRVSDADYKNMLSDEVDYLEKRIAELKDLQNRGNDDKE